MGMFDNKILEFLEDLFVTITCYHMKDRTMTFFIYIVIFICKNKNVFFIINIYKIYDTLLF